MTMTSLDRIHSRSTHDALRTSPRVRIRTGCLSARALRLADTSQHSQLGFALSRRTGNAVLRNRLRRQIRPVLNAADLPVGWAISVSVSPGRGTVTAREFRAQINQFVDRLRTQLTETV